MNRPQSGHVLIMFLILSSLFIGALGNIYANGMYLKDKTKALALCRSNLTDLQKDMKLSMSSLMKLNPLALGLRTAKKINKALLAKAALTGDLAMIKVYTDILNKITQRQRALAKKQKFILNSAYTNSIVKLKFLKQKMHGSTDTIDIPYSKRLAVKKKAPDSITPSYVPRDNFIENQKIKITWTQNPLRNVPDFVKKMFSTLPKIKEECSASLRKSGSTWKSVLI